ncbi:MAG: filamentous hemagglutinin N-terminal domain-containing protein, partial [Cyanobacteria bacterium P01_C01_bin.72]
MNKAIGSFQFPMRQRLVISSIIIGSCCGVDAAAAQILPDGTTDTSVVNNCQSACAITGGVRANQNLFHSFHEFNIPPGGSAYFANPGVDKIFSRITGSNPSEIFGTLGISGGNADLFLLNPNGIIFGAGAALDLNGSFFATTADEIKFGQQGSFFDTPKQQEYLALLTVNPSAICFNRIEPNGSIILDQASLNVSAKEDIDQVRETLSAEIPEDFQQIALRRLPKDIDDLETHGLLYLPGDYVVPGGKFNEAYGWDSYFILRGLLLDDEIALAKSLT